MVVVAATAADKGNATFVVVQIPHPSALPSRQFVSSLKRHIRNEADMFWRHEAKMAIHSDYDKQTVLSCSSASASLYRCCDCHRGIVKRKMVLLRSAEVAGAELGTGTECFFDAASLMVFLNACVPICGRAARFRARCGIFPSASCG
ncbi:hypothetical protein MESS2_190016 [Mesorhizobium metallidurans STM 2683]|uniref:Transposase n=1 Tax=Mesorhizobium metallidurans STM 2683 TaxID=1297569 RepID=M5ENN9_9HYPH|nr:hypothetical protein [Mesorhizobium metallidurans]CCV05947.1 hypothetical protein MESS2_190016 [Mesorhizobium metallidurans STM 2683]